ncbi:hypothetical protein G5V59_24695 [Nocardioides sp. W3-2-3]|nr:hypothetical protein [Nocardioides convexus]
MHAPDSSPSRIPQRALVAGGPATLLDDVAARLAATLDVPLVPADGLADHTEVQALADFDGWVSTAEQHADRAALLPRTEVVVVVLAEEPGTLRSLVRRTVRRIRAEDATVPDLAWVDLVAATYPDAEVVRLVGAEAIEAWLSRLV